MQYYNGADSAFPGAPLPPDTDILFVYIGNASKPGAPDTPHIWTVDECNLYMSPYSQLYGGPRLRIMPVYVHDYPGSPVTDADNALEAMGASGWNMDIYRILWWDAETLIDPLYTDILSQRLLDGRVRLGKYGSLSTVNANPPVPGGTWYADWQTTKPTSIDPRLGVARQWASPAQVGGNWDLTIADQFVYDNAGVGPR